MQKMNERKVKKEDNYRYWLLRKKLYESARSLLLNTISKKRGMEDETWIEVGEASAIVDLAGGAGNAYDLFANGAQKEFQNAKRLNKSLKFEEFWCCTDNPRFTSLGKSFLEWTKLNHVFTNVKISNSYARKMTAYMRELMDENKEDGSWSLSSLRFTFPNRKARNTTSKALSGDEKLKNALFLKLTREAWRSMCVQAVRKVNETVKRMKERRRKDSEPQTSPSDHDSSSKLQEDSEEEERRIESKLNNNDDDQYETKVLDHDDKPSISKKTVSLEDDRQRALSLLGIRKFRKWAEVDKESETLNQRQSRKDRLRKSKNQHKRWVENKNRLRIRLPSTGIETIKQRPQRLDFSKRGLARNKSAKMNKTTTVDLLGNLGLKYVHATGRRAENNRDLIECRNQLEKAGVILKENFVDDDGDVEMGRFRESREKSLKALRRAKKKEEEEGGSTKYRKWLEAKEYQEKAKKYLSAIATPADALKDPDVLTSETLRSRGDKDGDGKLSAEERWLAVGKALKSISQNLLNEWIGWSAGFKNGYVCTGMWHSFEPKACDVHAIGSVIRDTLVKLLRRKDIDFVPCFEKTYRDVRAREARKKNDGESLDRDQQEELEEQIERDLASSDAGLPYRDFSRMLRKRLGLELKEIEMNRLLRSLDKDNDGAVSMTEWKHFTDSSRSTSERLGERCVWQESCHQCGMPFAFALKKRCHRVPAAESKLGDDTDNFEQDDDENDDVPRMETQEHRRLLRHVDAISNLHDKSNSRKHAPKRCAAATWDPERSAKMLSTLRDMASHGLAIERAQKAKEKGAKPLPPILRAVRLESDSAEQLTTSLRLVWDTAPGSEPVAFFVLETCGREGSRTQKKQIWRTELVDPESAESKCEPAFQHIVDNLRADSSYHFRIRAFNGHGSSGYSHGIFATAPVAPGSPIVLSVDTNTVELCWTDEITRELTKNLKRLQKMFEEIDLDSSGTVSRVELQKALETDEELRELCMSTNAAPRAVRSRMSLSTRVKSNKLSETTIFDLIEQDDQDGLSWNEFLTFFGPRASRLMTKENKSSTADSGSSNSKSVVQCCVTSDIWKDVYVGCDTKCTVENLEPGRRYRFRVIYVNVDGIESAPSSSVVATCMLPVPPRPRLVDSAESALQLKLLVGTAAKHVAPQNFRRDNDPDDILKQWALSSDALRADREGGVNVREIFDRFDTNRNGEIDRKELAELLEALGAPHDELSVANAMHTMDTSKDKSIQFKEFSNWFTSTEVTMILKRDRGIACSQPMWNQGGARDDVASQIARAKDDLKCLPNSNGGACIMTLSDSVRVNTRNVSSASSECVVTKLRPNTLYRFWCRVRTPQAISNLSMPFPVMTLPARLRAPAVVSTANRAVKLRLYPVRSGAHSYAVEICGGSGGGTRRRNVSSSSSWRVAWEGRSALAEILELTPSTSYKMRVVPVNCWGGRGEPSPHVVIRTLSSRKEEIVPTSTNAVDLFRIECTSDVVIGDTILFTERVMGLSPDVEEVRRSSRKIKKVKKPRRQVVGEQTVCAIVTRERWSRASITKRSSNSNKGGHKNSSFPLQEVSSSSSSKVDSSSNSSLPDRSLCLRVLWSTASTPAASKELVAPNALIWRKERKLCHYEMHRIEWVDEESRLPYANQWEEYFSDEDGKDYVSTSGRGGGGMIKSKKSVQKAL